MKSNYKFYKKIKPDTFLWCVSMQTTIKFKEEVWIGVVSEHTTWCTGDKKVFYGNIFKNSTSLYITNKDIEFEVWEDEETVGERIKDIKDVPPAIKMPIFMDFVGVTPPPENKIDKKIIDIPIIPIKYGR